MSRGLKFDAQTSRKVEALYMTSDVAAQRSEVLKALQLREGERVLDVGVGPGLLAYDMAQSVGPDGHVCGIDLSDDMLAMSRKRCTISPGQNISEEVQQNYHIRITISMLPCRLRSTNMSPIFRQRSQSFIE